jgi:hypothetical protein
MSLALFISLTSEVLVALILVRAVKSGMFRTYLPFYSYLGFQLTVALMRWGFALSLGRRSDLYHFIYNLPTYVLPLLQMWILW